MLLAFFFPEKQVPGSCGIVYRKGVFLGRISKGSCCTFILSFLCNSFTSNLVFYFFSVVLTSCFWCK